MGVGDDTLRDYGGRAATHVRDPLIGQTVDEYEIQSIVGQGAMGIVYRGLHTLIGKTVAIKVLKPDFANDPDMVQRLIREARTVNAIRHPGIVDIFGFGTLKSTGQPFIVMDLLEGEPLDAVIRRDAPMRLNLVWPLLDELLAALGAAHSVGVIHRDLKPGNIFVESHPDARARVKVIDFGLARQADRAGGSVRPTNPGTLLGTPAFMAPEQVLGERVMPATDLYAVGGIAYQMLTGHLPHEAPSAIDVISQKMSFDPISPRKWNSKIDDELDKWILALLRKEVTRRPQSADDVRERLRRIAEGRTSSVTPAYQGVRSSSTPVPKPATGSQAVHKAGFPATPKPGPSAPGLSKPVTGAQGQYRQSPSPTPRRAFGEAKTVMQEGVSVPPELDTAPDQPSPFAKTAAFGAPSVSSDSGVASPQAPGGPEAFAKTMVFGTPGVSVPDAASAATPVQRAAVPAPEPSAAKTVAFGMMGVSEDVIKTPVQPLDREMVLETPVEAPSAPPGEPPLAKTVVFGTPAVEAAALGPVPVASPASVISTSSDRLEFPVVRAKPRVPMHGDQTFNAMKTEISDSATTPGVDPTSTKIIWVAIGLIAALLIAALIYLLIPKDVAKDATPKDTVSDPAPAENPAH